MALAVFTAINDSCVESVVILKVTVDWLAH